MKGGNKCLIPGPEGEECTKEIGIRTGQHRGPHCGDGKFWNVKRYVPAPPPKMPKESRDNGYMTEADYQTWGRLFR